MNNASNRNPHEKSPPQPKVIKPQGNTPNTDPANQTGIVENFQRLQKLAGNRGVQRLIQRSPLPSAITNNTAPFELDDETAMQIEKAQMGGQPLDSSVRSSLEPALGYDLSSVKVHTKPEDSQLSQTVGAKAFTLGQDVFFKEGSYNPDSSDGQHLLAHELTHVVQQSSGAVSGSAKMSVNAPGDSHEHEADRVAHEFTAQQAASKQANSQAVNQVQRKEEEL